MNNNDLNDPDSRNVTQEQSEQLVWERLQNEALAAQRWRLEQEMEQAGVNPVSVSGSGFSWLEMKPWTNRLVIVVVASFAVVSLVIAACCVW